MEKEGVSQEEIQLFLEHKKDFLEVNQPDKNRVIFFQQGSALDMYGDIEEVVLRGVSRLYPVGEIEEYTGYPYRPMELGEVLLKDKAKPIKLLKPLKSNNKIVRLINYFSDKHRDSEELKVFEHKKRVAYEYRLKVIEEIERFKLEFKSFEDEKTKILKAGSLLKGKNLLAIDERYCKWAFFPFSEGKELLSTLLRADRKSEDGEEMFSLKFLESPKGSQSFLKTLFEMDENPFDLKTPDYQPKFIPVAPPLKAKE